MWNSCCIRAANLWSFGCFSRRTILIHITRLAWATECLFWTREHHRSSGSDGTTDKGSWSCVCSLSASGCYWRCAASWLLSGCCPPLFAFSPRSCVTPLPRSLSCQTSCPFSAFLPASRRVTGVRSNAGMRHPSASSAAIGSRGGVVSS